ncbi:unnamed protein product [Coregonus sp. 'balchen']|nr:unnamed protein product [Coregonus sp. 'balchen']
MHFASSDVNPFVHQWQEEEPNQRCYKNQVFGSAADISCKSPMLDSTDKRITRCCSVDNGLNLQNCPFNSHLSTYANNKGLSSTLSSMEEDLKDQTSPKAHLKGHTNQASSIDDHNQPLIRTMSCNSSSCNDVSGDPGNSSGQVDEIMLVYSSERESQCNGFQSPETHTTCDHSTQTTMTQETMTQTTINHSDLQRRNNHHRRSSTQVPVSQKNTEASRKTTTWASLQNMSEHLSQLIHNTSDLLGNVQGMRSGDSLKHSPIRNVKSSSHLYSSKDWTKRDCSTQTAVDIGIQTERTPSTERSKAHEVNVIVKVIGSEVLNVSQEKELPLQHQLKNRPDDRIQSMPDLRLNGSTTGVSKQEEKSISTFGDQLSHRRHSIDYHHCRPSEGPVDCFSGTYEHSPLSDNTIQVQEDDMVSLAPSECNTDVLVNINPVTHTSNFQHSPQQRDRQCLPEDLPVHNKFTNWSGISQHPSDRGQISSSMKPAIYLPTGHKAQRNQPEWSSLSPESMFQKDRKTREIERLRKEREQVMSTVQLNMNPHQLTVELTEAKLHYGLGETDMLLKILTSGETKEEEPSAVPTKQQLYDRHRRSINGLRQERDARLQTCRRARSLSPSKHNYPHSPPQSQSPSHLRSPPQKAISSSRISTLPSQRREYLQQLRQEEVEGSRIPDPPRGEGHYPSEIEQLLRDYGRAREEARTEIARARERLRERTEQEKRRLQQQALSQVVKVTGLPDDGINVLKVRSRPPICGSQSVKTQRAWLSAQDVRLEPGVSGSDPLMSFSPSSPTSLRQCTASFGSASSISTAYQDLTSCLLGQAMAEVRLAAAGDMGNLSNGEGCCWLEGIERGVQAFYKPSSSPSVHSFLGVVELERPMASLWSMVRDHSKTHLYHKAVHCHLKQPRDFCCISTQSRQDDLCVLAMQSVFEESLPRPSVEAIRGEMLPSAWVLQPITRHGREVVRVIYLLQADLGTPSFPQKLLGTVARRQAAVLAELDSLFSL